MLDVKNPSNITLLERYVDPTAAIVPPVSNSTSNSDLANEEKSKLSTGATVGIAVGVSVAVSKLSTE